MRRPPWQMVPLKENRTLIWTVLAGIATALIAFLIPGSGLRHRMEQPPTFLFPKSFDGPGTAEAPAGQSPCHRGVRALCKGPRSRSAKPCGGY